MGGWALKIPTSLRSVDNDQLRRAAVDPKLTFVEEASVPEGTDDRASYRAAGRHPT